MSTLRVVKVPRQARRDGLGELDPSTAFLQDFGPGQGQLTIVCWGRAWTQYWGAMGSESLSEFILSAWTGYIVGTLMVPPGVILKRVEKNEERWVTDLVEALKDELRNDLPK